MGFHRRHLTKDFIISTYKKGDINDVFRLVTKPDSITHDSNCNICAALVDFILENNKHAAQQLIEDYIKVVNRENS